MQYTVSSRGQPIGVTDLGFYRIGGPSRSGWFHPNAEGERVMPTIASPLPAMRAYFHRDYRDDEGNPVVQPQLIGSALFADIAEALHRVAALELTLHRADGSLVPTESIGIQDVEQLLAMPDWDDPEDSAEPWQPVEIADDQQPPCEMDDEDELMLADDPPDDPSAWLADFEPPELPRYQIYVLLEDENAIP